MEEIPTIPPKTSKPIAWGDAGLIGAAFSLVIASGTFYLSEKLEDYITAFQALSPWLFLVAMILPTLITVAVYTAKNRETPDNLIKTIGVGLLSITAPVVPIIFTVALFGSSITYGKQPRRIAIISLLIAIVVYGCITFWSLITWYLLGRNPEKPNKNPTNTNP